VTGANRHNIKRTQPTLETLVVERPEPNLAHPQGMCLDAGYDYQEVRAILAECGFTVHIHSLGDKARELKQKAGSRAHRWVVEHL
jgi:hypothetical protein